MEGAARATVGGGEGKNSRMFPTACRKRQLLEGWQASVVKSVILKMIYC